MTMWIVVVIESIAIVLLGAAFFPLVRRRGRAVAVMEKAQAALNDMTGWMTRSSDVVVSIEAARAIAERRATEYFGVITDIERERDEWKKLFYESSRQSGVAQAWLVRDLTAAVMRANAYAGELRKRGMNVKDVALDATILELVRDYGIQFPDGKAAGVTPAPGLDETQKNPGDPSENQQTA